VRAECSGGTADVTLTRPSGAAVRDDESLLVVVSDFVATGGDGILTPVMPQGGFAVDHSAQFARDAFAGYLGKWTGPLREEPLVERGRQLIWSNCGR